MQSKVKKIVAVGATCAIAGAGAGIAGSAAAPKAKSAGSAAQGATGSTGTTGTSGARGPFGGRGKHGPGDRLGAGGMAVHAELVVPNSAGTGFQTVTLDSGKVKSVDGTTVTITEGTTKATYKTVDIDVGDSAKVERNHKTAKVSDLQAGDYVTVSKDSSGYRVHAETAAFRKSEQSQFGGHGGPPNGAPNGTPPSGAPGGTTGTAGPAAAPQGSNL